MASRKTTTSPCPPEPPQKIALGPDNPLVLTALREDNPRDFLAALGLLDLIDRLYPSHEVTMLWHPSGHPSLSCKIPLPENWLYKMACQISELNQTKPHPFIHHKIIKVSHPEFRKVLGRAINFSSNSDDYRTLPSSLYAAYGSQIHDLEQAETTPTAFSFSNAQSGKELLRDVGELITMYFNLKELTEFLTNNPAGRKDAKSFRWHPSELRSAAYRAHDPGGKISGDVVLDYPCANIFAFFGLTFYPVIDTPLRELTLGITRFNVLGDCFTWPIWTNNLSRDVITSLLHHQLIHAVNLKNTDLSSAGISGVFRCVRKKVGKAPTISLYFSPAEKIF